MALGSVNLYSNCLSVTEGAGTEGNPLIEWDNNFLVTARRKNNWKWDISQGFCVKKDGNRVNKQAKEKGKKKNTETNEKT